MDCARRDHACGVVFGRKLPGQKRVGPAVSLLLIGSTYIDRALFTGEQTYIFPDEKKIKKK
jgi:hypothetical protein